MSKLIIHTTVAVITFVSGVTLTNVWNWLMGDRAYGVAQVESAMMAVPGDDELLEIFRNYGPAQTRHDSAFFERVEANEFILFQDGQAYTRTQDIQMMNRLPSHVVFENEVLKLTLQGETAVVNSRMTATYEDGTKDSWLALDVCVQRDGHWQILSTTEISDY